MKADIRDETYGNITYTESFWTGSKSLYINGSRLKKVSKNTFSYCEGEEGGEKLFVVKGNYLTGIKLCVEGRLIPVLPCVKWYEIVLSVVSFALVMVWGNSVALCSILPVVGGAVGGGISGAFTVGNMLIIKRINNIWLKIVVSLGMCALCFIICMIIGFAIVGAFVWG